MKNAGYSDKEIMELKIARLFKEAYEQAALLTHSDIAHLSPHFHWYCEQADQRIYGKNREDIAN